MVPGGVVSGRWMVLGAGRVGVTLGRVLAREGVLVHAWTRSEASAVRARDALDTRVTHGSLAEVPPDVDVVLVALRDDVITRYVAALPDEVRARPDLCWLHTSGSRTAAALRDANVAGPCGSCHPLRSIIGAEEDVEALRGAFFALEGDTPAVARACWLGERCGATTAVLPAEAKVGYHAAAVLASNGVYALLHAAGRLAAASGADDPALRPALARLALGSAANAVARPLSEATTGPVVRGDAATVRAHRWWLDAMAPDALPLYQALADQLLAIADEAGLNPSALAAVQVALYEK